MPQGLYADLRIMHLLGIEFEISVEVQIGMLVMVDHTYDCQRRSLGIDCR